MKNLKKVLALVLAVVMIMGVVSVASAKTYTDVKATDDYADAIDALSSLNILDGFKDGDNYSFKADEKFTRAQAAKIVAIVHNAATNGKIKDQDAISALYSNAQNPFVDCNSNWALPFINYCRITGLADGMTATTYEPNRYVTGVQFLKLMLTTLNFDTAKEGYTGTGWDVNVLNRANEIGLTAGLAEGWKAIEPLKRGEAAQILYNAMTAYLVEYGQLVKNNYDTTGRYYKTSFISNEQVAQSGYTLGAKMGVTIKRATDAFRRPGYRWTYAPTGWTAFYMDAPAAEYKETVSACTILKDVIGLPEYKTTPIALDGVSSETETKVGYLMGGKADGLGTALNYVAIDGFKYLTYTLQHNNARNCQDTTGKWNFNAFGGQGDLTQVFETEDGYVITVIHTFLAKVQSVNAVDRKSQHTDYNTSTLHVWMELDDETSSSSTGFVANPPYNYTASEFITKAVSTIKYDEGAMVLARLSGKDTENVNKASYTNDATASIVGVAETKVGKLTGASDLHYPTTVSVDGTQYNGNCRFVFGRESAMNFKNWKTSYTFYFDSYGNVIGCGPVTGEAVNYAVMDKVYAEHVKGEYVLKGNLYINGAMVEDATIATDAGSFGKMFNADALAAANMTVKDVIEDIADLNRENLTDALYTYSVDDKGVYTLTWVGETLGQIDEPAMNWVASADLVGYGRFDSKPYEAAVQHIAKRASISFFMGGMNAVNVSESTTFICKGTDGTWKTYTGYTELPALTARYMDVVLEAEDSSFASVVYLGEVTYAADKIIGYVPTWKAYNWADGYDVITVYVKGEAVKVNLKHGDQYDGTFGDVVRDPGMYEFEMSVDKNGVAYAEIKIPTKTIKAVEGIIEECKDSTAIVIRGANMPAVALTGVKIFYVDGDKVTEITGADLRVNDYVIAYSEDGEITELYVYNADPRA